MVAAVILARELALRINRAAEFSAPDLTSASGIEQAAMLQILDQAVARLVHVAAHWLGASGPRRCRGCPSCCGRPGRSAPPRSTMHGGPEARAMAKVPGFRRTSLPSRGLKVDSDSVDRSVTSGTLDCIRNAISYWWMRRVRLRVADLLVAVHLVQFLQAIQRHAAHFRRKRRPGC